MTLQHVVISNEGNLILGGGGAILGSYTYYFELAVALTAADSLAAGVATYSRAENSMRGQHSTAANQRESRADEKQLFRFLVFSIFTCIQKNRNIT